MKLIFLLILSFLVILQKNIYFLAVFLTLLLILLSFHARRRELFSRLKPLFLISALVILFQLRHLDTAFLAALRIMTLSLLVFYYTTTTSVSRIIASFAFLPHSWQLMLTITLSLIPVIFSEAKKISLIQKSRGYQNKNPLPVIIPLLHRTLNRAEQIGLVIETRGY